jgi:hypothetical protein
MRKQHKNKGLLDAASFMLFPSLESKNEEKTLFLGDDRPAKAAQ